MRKLIVFSGFSMIEINLRDILQEGQEYVVGLGEKFGIDIKAFRHDKATDSCYEKLKLLGGDWTSDRIVKCVFFSGQGKLYGLVFPEFGTEENPERFSQKDLGAILGWDKKQISTIRNSTCPEGMEFGTCTPFVPKEVFEYDGFSMPLEKIFVDDAPWLEDKIVDISIGGYGEEAHKTSVQLPYSGIYKILLEKFREDKIVKENILVD